MTLGQWDANVPIERIRKDLQLDDLLSSSFLVTNLNVISRKGNVPFEVRKVVSLSPPSLPICEKLSGEGKEEEKEKE